MAISRIPMTAAGLAELRDELDRLRSKERPAIIRAISTAREHGDLSENAEYHAAKERQAFIEGRLAELEDIVRRAEVIDTTKMSGDIVRFGAIVLLADEDTNEEATYRIVGEHEGDIGNGRISVTAPLARALIGKTIGDVVEVTTPRGSKSYEIVRVSYS